MDDLLERIAAAGEPDEIGQLRVYADVLQGRGDSHGELIVVATDRLSRDTPELRRREEALIAEHRARLDAKITGELRPSYRWHRGFVDAIAFDYAGDTPFDALPVLAGEPVFRLLRRIELTTQMMDGSGDVGPTLAELARLAPRFPRLVEIAVRYSGNFGNPWIDGPPDIHDVTPLYTAYPRLEVLELGGDNAQLGAIDLPALRRFVAYYLEVDDVRRFVAARLPRIAELVLGFRAQLCDNVAATFGPLLHRDFGPQLTSLSLAPPDQAIAYVIGELPTSPLARHLRQLSLRFARLDDRHYPQLVTLAPQLRHLDRLELSERPIPAATLKRLHGAYGRRLALV